MIHIKNVAILDMLPFTFKTQRGIALSRAIKALTVKLYDNMSSVLFWADIDNASPALLDAMAAEVDAPFYSTDLAEEQKKSIIKAAFVYNSRIGTVSSVEGLLSASFGKGKISEWFNYGGAPYYFKIDLYDNHDGRISGDNIEMFFTTLEKIKNKRSKLEVLDISTDPTQGGTYHAGSTAVFGRVTIPFDTSSLVDDTIYSKKYHGGGVAIMAKTTISTRQYRTYEELRPVTYDDLKSKTYEEILYKEDN